MTKRKPRAPSKKRKSTAKKSKPSPKPPAKRKSKPAAKPKKLKQKATWGPPIPWEDSADSLAAAMHNLAATHEANFLYEQLEQPMRAACTRASTSGKFDVAAFRKEAAPIVEALVEQGNITGLTAYDIEELLGAFRVVHADGTLFMRMLPLAEQILRERAAPSCPTPEDWLKEMIRSAFSNTTRPEWILDDVVRGQLLDGQEETLAAFADKTWQTVEAEVLDKESLDLLGPAGFHYYAPAYMLRALQRWGTYSSGVTWLALAINCDGYDDERNLQRLAMFSDAQVDAVIAFLKWVLARPGFDDEQQERTENSLAEFWTPATRRRARRQFGN
nr:DUF6714 family protein [Kofleriaceae bacterium]